MDVPPLLKVKIPCLLMLLGGRRRYSATAEERYLTEQFPNSYPLYKRSTKMLVPFIFCPRSRSRIREP